MRVINWLALHPTSSDLEGLQRRIKERLPVQEVCECLVLVILKQYPWDDREDLIPVYHPAITFDKDQYVAFLQPDSHRNVLEGWDIAKVKHVEWVKNPIQGEFQVLTLLKIDGTQTRYAGGIPCGEYDDFSKLAFPQKREDLRSLSKKFVQVYGKYILDTLKSLCQSGRLRGFCSEDTYFPEREIPFSFERLSLLFEDISPDRPWLTIEDLLSRLPELQRYPSDQARQILSACLRERSYLDLGGGRWTTRDLYNRLNREISHELPVPRIRSRLEIWTDEGTEDTISFKRRKRLPFLQEFPDFEDDEEVDEVESGNNLDTSFQQWSPPAEPIKLPPLNYLHITQAYFPVSKAMRIFPPGMRLVFVQFIEGEDEIFLLNRKKRLLIAKDRDRMRRRFLEYGIPAGTYLWLEYRGGERYRIAPRPLPEEKNVECKLAYMQNGELQIEHTQIPMRYEYDPYVFKADLRFEDIEALFTEARQLNLSIRDVILETIKELCETDPYKRAYYKDIFNVVFLKRMCSASSVQQILYGTPCFEHLGKGYFRYNPELAKKNMACSKRRSSSKSRKTPAKISESENPSGVFEEVKSDFIVSEVPEIEIEPATREISIYESESSNPEEVYEPQIYGDDLPASKHESDEVETEMVGIETPTPNLSVQEPEFDDHPEGLELESVSHESVVSALENTFAVQSELMIESKEALVENFIVEPATVEQTNLDIDTSVDKQASPNFEFLTITETLVFETEPGEEIPEYTEPDPLAFVSAQSEAEISINEPETYVPEEIDYEAEKADPEPVISESEQDLSLPGDSSSKTGSSDLEILPSPSPSPKGKKSPFYIRFWLVMKRWFRFLVRG